MMFFTFSKHRPTNLFFILVLLLLAKSLAVLLIFPLEISSVFFPPTLFSAVVCTATSRNSLKIFVLETSLDLYFTSSFLPLPSLFVDVLI